MLMVLFGKLRLMDYDAQDEYALIDPVGVGEHEFKVYFQSSNGYLCQSTNFLWC